MQSGRERDVWDFTQAYFDLTIHNVGGVEEGIGRGQEGEPR